MTVSRGWDCRRWFKNRGWESLLVHVLSRDDKEVQLRVRRDRNEFTAYLDLSGAGRHHCTCSFFAANRSGPAPTAGWCAHLVAGALHCGQEEMILPFLLAAGR